MKGVLVTGCCGNIGANVVDLLVQRGYRVRGVDLDTKKNREAATRWGGQVELCFGSICNDALVAVVVSGMDHVIHLAAIVPPATDVDQASQRRGHTFDGRCVRGSTEATAPHLHIHRGDLGAQR
jgi:nucleoside-diphosphate-sugar epimerase